MNGQAMVTRPTQSGGHIAAKVVRNFLPGIQAACLPPGFWRQVLRQLNAARHFHAAKNPGRVRPLTDTAWKSRPSIPLCGTQGRERSRIGKAAERALRYLSSLTFCRLDLLSPRA
jgi:hypothetical protein